MPEEIINQVNDPPIPPIPPRIEWGLHIDDLADQILLNLKKDVNDIDKYQFIEDDGNNNDINLEDHFDDIFVSQNIGLTSVLPVKLIIISKGRDASRILRDNIYKIWFTKNSKSYNCIVDTSNNKIKKLKFPKSVSVVEEKLKNVNLYDIVLKSCEESGDIFGYKSIKKKMFKLNKPIKNITLHKNYLCKKDKINRDCVEIYCDINNKNLKFLLSDITIKSNINFSNFIKSFIPITPSKKLEKGTKIIIRKNEYDLYNKEVKYISTTNHITSSTYMKVEDKKGNIYILNKNKTKFKIK